jgi:PAS domain-containing protein
MTASRRGAVTRAMRDLREAVARIQTEGGDSEQVLRKRAETLIARLGSVPVAMLVADNRGRYVDVNDAAVCLTGYSRAELLRRSVWDLTPTGQQTRGRTLWRAFLARADVRAVPVTAKGRPCRGGAACRPRQCPARPARLRARHTCVGHALSTSAQTSRRMNLLASRSTSDMSPRRAWRPALLGACAFSARRFEDAPEQGAGTNQTVP